VYEYNKVNDPIELETEKDYRVVNNHCDLNEILIFYNEMYNNDELFKEYF